MARKSASSSVRSFSILGMEDVEGIVNSDAIEGTYAKHVGAVTERDPKELGKKFYADTTHILIIADIPARSYASVRGKAAQKREPVFHVDAFEDEGLLQKRLYENIPDLETAEMLAKAAWTGLNQYAGRWDRALIAAAEKYKA